MECLVVVVVCVVYIVGFGVMSNFEVGCIWGIFMMGMVVYFWMLLYDIEEEVFCV